MAGLLQPLVLLALLGGLLGEVSTLMGQEMTPQLVLDLLLVEDHRMSQLDLLLLEDYTVSRLDPLPLEDCCRAEVHVVRHERSAAEYWSPEDFFVNACSINNVDKMINCIHTKL